MQYLFTRTNLFVTTFPHLTGQARRIFISSFLHFRNNIRVIYFIAVLAKPITYSMRSITISNHITQPLSYLVVNCRSESINCSSFIIVPFRINAAM